MDELQNVYDQIIKILEQNNVIMDITPPRPYLIKKDIAERIDKEEDALFKEHRLDECNLKMEEKEKYKLYFDVAYKYYNFYSRRLP